MINYICHVNDFMLDIQIQRCHEYYKFNNFIYVGKREGQHHLCRHDGIRNRDRAGQTGASGIRDN